MSCLDIKKAYDVASQALEIKQERMTKARYKDKHIFYLISKKQEL